MLVKIHIYYNLFIKIFFIYILYIEFFFFRIAKSFTLHIWPSGSGCSKPRLGVKFELRYKGNNFCF